MSDSENHLIWLDCEMTGLEPDTDRIIEIATIVTDRHLNTIAEGPALVIHQPQTLMDNMNEWCVEQHGRSGLTQRVLDSTLNEAEAEKLTLDFLKQHVPAGTSPMCGNTIYQDRRFLYKYMPSLEAFFHYRNVDVSTLKELAKRWAEDIYDGFVKESEHLALQDIRDSIDELKYYREKFLTR